MVSQCPTQFDHALLTLHHLTALGVVGVIRRDTAHAWTAIATTIVLGLGFINMVMYSMNCMGLEIGSGE